MGSHPALGEGEDEEGLDAERAEAEQVLLVAGGDAAVDAEGQGDGVVVDGVPLETDDDVADPAGVARVSRRSWSMPKVPEPSS